MNADPVFTVLHDHLIRAQQTTIARLLKQLSPNHQVNFAQLLNAASQSRANVIGVWLDERLVGIAVFIVFNTLQYRKGFIEDVVVDEGCRGQGIGAALVQHLIALAQQERCDCIELTSNPNNANRKPAIALYQKYGFAQRETNVFRLTLAR